MDQGSRKEVVYRKKRRQVTRCRDNFAFHLTRVEAWGREAFWLGWVKAVKVFVFSRFGKFIRLEFLGQLDFLVHLPGLG
jgi:hypothetical protein